MAAFTGRTFPKGRTVQVIDGDRAGLHRPHRRGREARWQRERLVHHRVGRVPADAR